MDTSYELELLARVDTPVELTPAVDAALDALGADLAALAAAPPDATLSAAGRHAARALRRSRRRRQRLLTGAAGLAILAAAAPAAATYVHLHSGHYGLDGPRYGEFLNLDSPDGIRVLHKFEADYPLPPGGSWDAMEHRFLSGPPGLGQVGVYEEAVGGESQCQWTQAWLAADATGDRTAADAAADVLAEIPSWHVITAYEDETKGVEILARQVADGAARGDRAPAQQYVDANCSDLAPGQ
jgi:hypothetical protein